MAALRMCCTHACLGHAAAAAAVLCARAAPGLAALMREGEKRRVRLAPQHDCSLLSLQPAAHPRCRAAAPLHQVLGEDLCAPGAEEGQWAALDACLAVNAPLLHRVVTRRPLGVLKYAMTLDGKIATAQAGAGRRERGMGCTLAGLVELWGAALSW